VKALAQALDGQLMQPVRKLLGERRTVFVSPDGLLHLVPFVALVDEQERYLVEQYRFIYLTTGRDLRRLQVKTPPTQGPLVLADPDFGPAAEGLRGLQIMPSTATTAKATTNDAVDAAQLSSPAPRHSGRSTSAERIVAQCDRVDTGQRHRSSH
jgi:CHAT domain-containing protein